MDLLQNQRFDGNNESVVDIRNTIFSPNDTSLMTETNTSHLQYTTRTILTTSLGGKGKIVTRRDQKGVRVSNNYAGVAELSGINLELSRNTSPVLDLLQELGEKQLIVLDFISILIIIRREDVVKRCRANILNDCRIYSEEQMMRIRLLSLNESEYDDNYSSTRHEKDRVWPFAAFICSAQADGRLARHLVERLEKQGFKVFYPERDLLPGSPINSVNAFFIEERCKHVIVILTEAFSRSPECLFQLKFTNALDQGAAAMKIIPVKFDDDAPVPRTLNFVNMCNMKDGGWLKLVQTLKSSHRVNKEILEQIAYPQHNTIGVHGRENMKTIDGDSLPGIHSMNVDGASSMNRQTVDVALPAAECISRLQPDGQELSLTGPATKKEQSPTLYRRATTRSISAPVETTV